MKRIISYILIAVVAVSLSSCKDFLNREPLLKQSTELTLSTYEGLDLATLGAYSPLAGDSWYGGVRVLTSEMRSGNGVKSLKHTSNRYTVELNWNYTPDAGLDVSAIWADGYDVISRANNVINNLDGKTSADVSEQMLNNLKAECLFLRAFGHFEIVNLFGRAYAYDKESLGCPVILVTDPSDQSPRATVADVYKQIVEDLKEAEKIISPSYKRSGIKDGKAAVDINVIRALLSRVYLYMEDWQNAADYAGKVIDSGDYALWTSEDYLSAWNGDTGGDEVIFEIYKDMNNLSNLDCCYMTNPDGAYGDCLCSEELYDMYADGDVRKEMYRQDADGNADLYWTLKYAGKGINTPDANNVIILRLSEMYLNRAEALVKLDKTEDALSDLNAIAGARGAASYSGASLQSVKDERRKELAWEGHHFYDCARWKVNLTRTPDTFLNPNNAVISANDKRWALPIPKREMEVNANLVQNPGY